MSTLKNVADHAAFVVMYFAAMTLLMAVALEIEALVSGIGHPINSNVLTRLPMTLATVLIAFSFSGFLLVHLAVYCLLMHELPRTPRLLLSVLVFLVAFVVLISLIGDSFGIGEARLFFMGVVAVVLADTLAEIASKKWRETELPQNKSSAIE